ncbi:MAG: zf-TFIIB domain-containing protein [Vicinamibacterales bacterium]
MPMNCPNCRAAMTSMTLEGHYQRSVVIDMCEPCQAFWFDGLESLQLEPASVLELFRIVGKAGGGARAPLANGAGCPRCAAQLLKTFDQQRGSRFEYQRCPEGHGRLTSFYNFLREKDFIRPLSAAQIEELRRNLRSINCSNCGAAVDLAKGTACAHCGSPLSMLDVGQAEALVAALRGQSTRTGAFERDPGWYGAASSGGLVNAALGAFSRWLVAP